MMKINKVLIANRGEIAQRVIRTLKKMNISSVAIYSTADANAPFVRMADEAFCVGEGPSAQSYLLQDKIIDICLNNNVDAIHPGYGFLSENADFARALTKNNIKLIGPSDHAMELMGSKLKSKETVKDFGVPLVPGTDYPVTDPNEAVKISEGIGYPVLVKASAGGGGKGMRVVENSQEMKEQMELAISEAKSSFGDGAVFLEKFVLNPRHIEIQILADQHGNVIHLLERECSIQRRHQKVIEEAPSAVLTEELRQKMGEAACQVAKSCNYEGAGTVEFLIDKDLNFYFLEMNTRLQVEHPVTEMVTGLDLVEWQVKIAEGEVLTIKQEDVKPNGHALEVRVYAEDAYENFNPDIGNLEVYVRPTGEGVRVDDAFEQGMDIPIYYDPMIAKLIVHAPSRILAIDRMTKAIDDYVIKGVKTTLGFGKFAINHEAFVSGDFDTDFVKKYYDSPSVLQNFFEDEKNLAIQLSEELLHKENVKEGEYYKETNNQV